MTSHFEPCGYIGTIAIEYADIKLPPLLTTPDVIDLHRIMADMKTSGMKACALEVSSIGLEQHRVDAVDFDVAIFTNFTHDHLDYHGTMENYFEAKKVLFDNLNETQVAIYNVDDPRAVSAMVLPMRQIIVRNIFRFFQTVQFLHWK